MTSPLWPFPRADSLPIYPFLAADEIKRRVIATGADLIDLGLGNPDQATPAEIVRELHTAADRGENHRYYPGRGSLLLRRAVSRWYERRYEARFDAEEEVLVTMGAKEGISHLCLAVLDRGDVAVVPDPCYPIHEGAPIIAGADVVRYAVRPDMPPARAVADALGRVRAGGRRAKLVIANYPHNPTGTVITREELAALVRVVRDAGALLLHDLAYADLDFTARHAPSIFDCGLDSVTVRSFAVEIFSMSKSYNMPGWRIGVMAGNARMVSALSHLKAYVDYGTFMPIQLAAAWALDHGDGLVDVIRERYQSRMQALLAGLGDCGWAGPGAAGSEVAPPGGTMFVWAPLPHAWRTETALEVTRRLIEEAHVAVSPGSGFGAAGEGFVRFSLIEEPERLREACVRIQNALAGATERVAGAAQ